MQSLAFDSKWLAATLSPEGLIASLSSVAEQVTGYSAQELVGLPVTQILADSSAFEIPRILDSAKECGYWEGEIVHRGRGGKLLDARATVSLLSGLESHSAGYLLLSNLDKGSVPDKCGYSALVEVAEKLRTFAHDLNNPLAVTMGFAQLLILNTNEQGRTKSDLDKLYCELKRVIQVVEKLHRYAISLNGHARREVSSESQIEEAVAG